LNQVKTTTTNAAGNPPRVNLIAGTNYAITSALTVSAAQQVVFQGCTATPGDGGRATISGPTTGTQFVLITFTGGPYHYADIIFIENGATGGTQQNGISLTFTSSYAIFERCTFASMGLSGVSCAPTTSTVSFIQCESYSNDSAGGTGSGFNLAGTSSAYLLDRCISSDNQGPTGYILGTGCSASFVNCIAYGNVGPGFQLNATSWASFDGCAAYQNYTDGFACLGGFMILTNCISTSNGGYGFNPSTGAVALLRNCASYSNTSGRSSSALVDDTGAIALSNDPYVNGVIGNFALSSQAGSGALCRGTGVGSFTISSSDLAVTTIGFPDVGPAQCANSGGALRPSVVSPSFSPSLFQ
jgi:hypothetical protein